MTASLYDLPIFDGLDPVYKRTLGQVLSERTLKAGDVLFRQGDLAGSCFVVLAGEIVVEAELEGGAREPLSVLGRGELFGEVALLDGGDRSATCIAGPEGARVAELPRDEFDRLYNAGDAFAYHLMDVILDRLVLRLRDATGLLLDVAAE